MKSSKACLKIPPFGTHRFLLFKTVKIEGPNAAGIELVKTSDTIPGKVQVYPLKSIY